jgi:hypothetical protein
LIRINRDELGTQPKNLSFINAQDMQEVEEKPNFDTELSEENEYDYSV